MISSSSSTVSQNVSKPNFKDWLFVIQPWWLGLLRAYGNKTGHLGMVVRIPLGACICMAP